MNENRKRKTKKIACKKEGTSLSAGAAGSIMGRCRHRPGGYGSRLRKSARLPVALFCLSGLILSHPAFLFAGQEPAGNEQSILKLNEMVVTATKVEEPKSDVSTTVQVITSKDIKESTAKNAGDLLAEAGLGHVTSYGTDFVGSVEIRGLQTDMFNPLQSRVLILVNGSNAGTANLAQIPVDDIARIEIVKGPASVIYGSSAMGGVINIITKEGKGSFHGSVGGGVGSWGSWNAAAESGGATNRFDYYVTAATSAHGDVDDGNGHTIANSAYHDQAVSGRFGYTLPGGDHLSLGFQHWMGWHMGSPGPTYDPTSYDYDNQNRDAADLTYKAQTFQAKYYSIESLEKWITFPGGGPISGSGNSTWVYRTTTDTQGVSLHKVFSFGDRQLILGGQWDRMEIDSRSNQGAPYYPDARYDTFGAFADGRIGLFHNRLLLNMGIRNDYFANSILATPGMTSLVPREDYLDHWTWRGGLVYKILDGLSFKGNVGTAFRAPAPLELASDYIYYGTHYLGNSDLKPEQSLSYDAGLNYKKKALKADITFFYTDFKDKIVSVYDSVRNVSTYTNAGGAVIDGVELNAAYDLGATLGAEVSIEPFANITYTIQRLQKNDGAPDTTLLNTPVWTGAFGLKVGTAMWNTMLIANYTGEQKVTDWNYLNSTYGQTITQGGFTVLSLKATYRPAFVSKNLELSLSVQNLLDTSYAYKPGYPMPGITVMAGAKWHF